MEEAAKLIMVGTIHKSIVAIAGISMIVGTGCFSYHKTTTETPEPAARRLAPSQSTTTSTTTQSTERVGEGTFYYDVRAVNFERMLPDSSSRPKARRAPE